MSPSNKTSDGRPGTESHPRPAHLASGWETLDQAARDAAYNNQAAVSDSAALVDIRNRLSATFRDRHADHLDLPYAAGDRCRWDLFPGAEASAPCLVLIHGGWWHYNSRENFACCVAGALECGWSAALPGYTLAPDASLTQIVTEIGQALDWLADNGPRHGIAGPILLSGWSAGGHLAAMWIDHPLVCAGLAISGVFDLAPIRDTYINRALQLTDTELATLSPARLQPSRKPLTVAYGDRELPEMRRQSADFAAWRQAHGCPGGSVAIAGADHFRILDALSRRDGELMQVVARLVDRAELPSSGS